MKSRIKKEYIEMPFQVFIENCPDAINLFPPEVRSMLMSDSEYLVRLSEDGTLEVGYKSDKWSIS